MSKQQSEEQTRGTKYRTIAEQIREQIAALDSRSITKLPSDNELSEKFGVSRLTVIRSLRILEAEGLVRRRTGSGTFTQPGKVAKAAGYNFGLLIPDLGEGEIFEPICKGMSRAQGSNGHTLLWGNSPELSRGKRALELCEDFISKRVSGVFFAPLELDADMEDVNARILARLEEAKIPVVFLDRSTQPYPLPPTHDLVGIDNWREGARMADYVFAAGARRVGFVVRPGSAPTVEARIAGLLHATWRRGQALDPALILCGDPSDVGTVREWWLRAKPEGILCANDFTAGQLMHSLLEIGVAIPEDVKIVGFDDVKYASLLPVPLTTLRQPCEQIGATTVSLMIERLENPTTAPRTVTLACEIIARRSC